MALYHFTDVRNIQSIQRRGLLSWRKLFDWNIQHYPASNEVSRRLDERAQLSDYVRLCLHREHPMEYVARKEGRIYRVVWLEIDSSVTRWRATKFSDINATANDATINHDYRTAYNSPDTQAEVLVQGGINVKWITFP
jgi:hypothetical protein